MASTITVTRTVSLSVVDTFSTALPSDQTATFDPQAATAQYTAASSVPVTKHSEFSMLLSSGAGTIDLTALPGKTIDETVDGTGLKVQMCCFSNPGTNANSISITFGAANPYLLLGTGWKITLLPGQSTGPFFLDQAAPDVAGGAKNIDVSGTGAQGLDIEFVLG